jgi:hypothetical protein
MGASHGMQVQAQSVQLNFDPITGVFRVNAEQVTLHTTSPVSDSDNDMDHIAPGPPRASSSGHHRRRRMSPGPRRRSTSPRMGSRSPTPRTPSPRRRRLRSRSTSRSTSNQNRTRRNWSAQQTPQQPHHSQRHRSSSPTPPRAGSMNSLDLDRKTPEEVCSHSRIVPPPHSVPIYILFNHTHQHTSESVGREKIRTCV